VFDYEVETVTMRLAGEAVVFNVVVDGKTGRIALSRMEWAKGLFSLEFKPILRFQEGLERDARFNLVYEVIIHRT
jgi:hypothetical protein